MTSSLCDHARNLYFLDVPPAGKLTQPLPATGSAWFKPLANGAPLQGDQGYRYIGLPVIGVSFGEYVNGLLVDDQGVVHRANYGQAQELIRVKQIDY